MLLRTSSNPVGQRTHFLDNHNKDSDSLHLYDNSDSSKVSFIQDQLYLSSLSCDSSPIYRFNGELSEFNVNSRRKLFRRAKSDGDLEGLASISFDIEELYNSKVLNTSLNNNKPQMEQNKSGLRTEPSFSIYSSNDGVAGNYENLERTTTTGESIRSLGSGQFSFRRNSMAQIEENEESEEVPLNEFEDLGIEDESGQSAFDENGEGVEEDYKRMINEDPSNPLFLRNYAQFLQSKGDIYEAEDFYFRATLADPNDCEILVQYARLLWDIHHDKARASSYFEKAARLAPEDSHVLGAYASFLWNMDDDNDDEDEDEGSYNYDPLKVKNGGQEDIHYTEENRPASPPLHLATGLGIDITGFGSSISPFNYMTTDFDDGGSTENYYRMMVEQNPSNPLFLRNFAHFLFEMKGDLEAAEEYYSRAILADPSDGETLSQYAKLIWQLHNDREKASSYFEQAIQAAPEDSNVLGAYARFLWEFDDDKDENNLQKALRVPQGLVAATATA